MEPCPPTKRTKSSGWGPVRGLSKKRDHKKLPYIQPNSRVVILEGSVPFLSWVTIPSQRFWQLFTRVTQDRHLHATTGLWSIWKLVPTDQFFRHADCTDMLNWDSWIEGLFVHNCNDDCQNVYVSFANPFKREYAFLSAAMTDIPVDPIVCSWAAPGIPWSLWGDVPSIKPMIDISKKQMGEETQEICECGSLTACETQKCIDYVCDGCWEDPTIVLCGEKAFCLCMSRRAS